MTLANLLHDRAVMLLGWGLVHFLWQGVVLALLLAAALRSLRGARPQARYLAGCVTLGLLAACPAGTIAWLALAGGAPVAGPVDRPALAESMPRAGLRDVPVQATRDGGLDGELRAHMATLNQETADAATSDPASETLAPPTTTLPPRGVEGEFVAEADRSAADAQDAAATTPAIAAPPFSAAAATTRSIAEPPFSAAATGWPPRWLSAASEAVQARIPWLVAAWLAGVALLSARLGCGWLRVERLRRRGHRPARRPWQDALAQVAARLRVSRPVRLVESALVEVPTVIGALRPIILLPASALTGLTPAQVTALLAHELAHIRRHDYLVNLLQTCLETLLFYHPAVWWASARVRQEREHCCDDLAIAACGDRAAYALALAVMEELRTRPAPLVAAAAGGSLVERIRRIAGRPEATRITGYDVLPMLCAAVLLAVVVMLRASVTLIAEDGAAPSRGEVLQHEGNAPTAGGRAAADGNGNEVADRPPDESAQDEGTRRLVDGLLARVDAVRSGRYKFEVQQDNGRVANIVQKKLVCEGESWRLQMADSQSTFELCNHKGRLLRLEKRSRNAKSSRPAELTMDWSSTPIEVPPSPQYAGTLWTAGTRKYVRGHATEARRAETKVIQSMPTEILEWNVDEASAAHVFQLKGENAIPGLTGGGVLRVFVAPQLGHAVPRIEFADQYGLVHFICECGGFRAIGGVEIPEVMQVKRGSEVTTLLIKEVSDINAPIAPSEFQFTIPAGTQVIDVRWHKGDIEFQQKHPEQNEPFDQRRYPLRRFRTGAEDLPGLPESILREMDRDVLSPEESLEILQRSRTAAGPAMGLGGAMGLSQGRRGDADSVVEAIDQPAPPAAGTSGESAQPAPPAGAASSADSPPVTPKRVLRYENKTFDEWRDELLTELAHASRVQALHAVGALGAAAHADETVALVLEVLQTAAADERGRGIADDACSTLARLGSAGMEGLRRVASEDKYPHETRQFAVNRLSRHAATSPAAFAALLALVRDAQGALRLEALRALASHRLGDEQVAALIRTALISGDAKSRRLLLSDVVQSGEPQQITEFLQGLWDADKSLGDEATADLRWLAAVVMAVRGPDSSAVFETLGETPLERSLELRELLRNLPPLCKSFDPADDFEPISLTRMLENEALYAPQSKGLIHAIAGALQFHADRGRGRGPVRTLIRVIDGKIPEIRPAWRIQAAEALGELGPTARGAVDSLIEMRRREAPAEFLEGNDEPGLGPPTAEQWDERVRKAIERIAGK